MNEIDIPFNLNTLLSVGAVLGVAIVGWVQKEKVETVNDLKERISEIRNEQVRQADRIDRIYDKLINGKSK